MANIDQYMAGLERSSVFDMCGHYGVAYVVEVHETQPTWDENTWTNHTRWLAPGEDEISMVIGINEHSFLRKETRSATTVDAKITHRKQGVTVTVETGATLVIDWECVDPDCTYWDCEQHRDNNN